MDFVILVQNKKVYLLQGIEIRLRAPRIRIMASCHQVVVYLDPWCPVQEMNKIAILPQLDGLVHPREQCQKVESRNSCSCDVVPSGPRLQLRLETRQHNNTSIESRRNLMISLTLSSWQTPLTAWTTRSPFDWPFVGNSFCRISSRMSSFRLQVSTSRNIVARVPSSICPVLTPVCVSTKICRSSASGAPIPSGA